MMPEQAELTPHEKKVMYLILTLEGNISGFPDTSRKLSNVARAWAAFISFEPYRVQFNPQVAASMSEEEKAAFAWKEGVIPGEWLVKKIRDSCEFMPAPVVARELYCSGGFTPADGQTMEKLPDVGRRRTVRPADMEAE